MPFCTACGRPVAPEWPRRCGCGHTAYRNPTPVAVLLLPVHDGLLVVRRAINPGRGLPALPGGFIEYGETWQQAAARECAEEAGVPVDPAGIALFDTVSAPDGTLLVFGIAPRVDDPPPSRPTQESTGWEVLRAPAPLAFPLHTAAVRRYFDSTKVDAR
ncbi:NUDIX domain-containing protein [Actinokineospora fastidiosa]|uniref:NUDIX hydrolase n=1 Tax=Actinokineospora fastidiosa TaxID=1816 RepID=A0A918LFQ0_9PSEU|nr:NUDIX domain-containing protein [Actinokineospora fastidiosa]GGS41139.1 NUDIX hydrolase [Actinokineospora fastidiosa]